MPESQQPVSVETHPAVLRPIRLEIPSDPAAIAAVRLAIEEFALSAGASSVVSGEIGLVVNEALANVIRHAYDGRTDRSIVVNAECHLADVPPQKNASEGDGSHGVATPKATSRGVCPGATLRVTIRDWGNGVNPAALPVRDHDPQVPGGIGLICLRKLMDSAVFSPQPDGMLLTLIKRIS